MKKMLLTFTFLLTAFCLFAQQATIEQLVFESATRGYKKKVEITPDSVFISETNFMSSASPEENRRATREGEWEQLVQALEGVEPAGLSELQAPGKARTFDAAKHSTLTVITGSQAYQTPVFDGYNPHPKLQPLMDAIKKVEEGTSKEE